MGKVIELPQKPGWEEKVEAAVKNALEELPESARAAAAEGIKATIHKYKVRPAEFKCTIPEELSFETVESLLVAMAAELDSYFAAVRGEMLVEIVTLKMIEYRRGFGLE